MPDNLFYYDTIDGNIVCVNHELGHMWIEHEGNITWDELQKIKNVVWGEGARAIEVYPRQKDVINSIPCRHLWRLSDTDFAPDLLGNDGHEDSLQTRYSAAWKEARE